MRVAPWPTIGGSARSNDPWFSRTEVRLTHLRLPLCFTFEKLLSLVGSVLTCRVGNGPYIFRCSHYPYLLLTLRAHRILYPPGVARSNWTEQLLKFSVFWCFFRVCLLFCSRYNCSLQTNFKGTKLLGASFFDADLAGSLLICVCSWSSQRSPHWQTRKHIFSCWPCCCDACPQSTVMF
jgi:hypothetical protein